MTPQPSRWRRPACTNGALRINDPKNPARTSPGYGPSGFLGAALVAFVILAFLDVRIQIVLKGLHTESLMMGRGR
jgi:hypothetical protein